MCPRFPKTYLLALPIYKPLFLVVSMIMLSRGFTSIWACLTSIVTDQKKKGEGRRQSRKFRRTPEFSLAHDPQMAPEGWDAIDLVPDLQSPWNDLQSNENSENEKEQKTWRNSGEAEPYESTSKPPFYTTKVIP